MEISIKPLSCENHYKGPVNLYKKFDFETVNEHKDYYVLSGKY